MKSIAPKPETQLTGETYGYPNSSAMCSAHITRYRRALRVVMLSRVFICNALRLGLGVWRSASASLTEYNDGDQKNACIPIRYKILRALNQTMTKSTCRLG